MRTWARSALLAVPIFLLLQIPSARAIYHYSPWPEATLAVIFLAYVVGLRLAPAKLQPVKVLDSWIVCAAFLSVLWGAIFRLYFYVKSLPLTPTSDTALIAPIEALKLGRGLYDLDGLINVSASPGPAWVLLNAPFTFAGVSIFYTLLSPAYVLFGWLMLRAAGHSVRLSNAWMLLLFSGLISWELAVGGYDIIALSVMVMALFLLVERFSLGKLSGASIVVAVAVGLFGTSRVVFAYLAPLLGLLVWKQDRSHAILFTLIALATTAGVHAAFFFQSEYYHPFHLFERAETRVGMGFVAAGSIATAIVLIGAILLMKDTPASRLGWFTMALATPFAFISVAELASNGWRLQGWEGGNYLVPVVATAILFVLRKLEMDPASKPEPVQSSHA